MCLKLENLIAEKIGQLLLIAVLGRIYASPYRRGETIFFMQQQILNYQVSRLHVAILLRYTYNFNQQILGVNYLKLIDVHNIRSIT